MEYKIIPDVTLKMIISVGLIESGTKVYSKHNPSIEGILDENGAISFRIGDEFKRFPYPSGAARYISKTSVNGWKYWRILEDGIYNELSVYKERYKQSGFPMLS